MTSDFPVAIWAILMAPSLAAEPPDTLGCTLVNPAGEVSTSRCTRPLIGSLWYEEVRWTTLSSWSFMAAMTAGWE